MAQNDFLANFDAFVRFEAAKQSVINNLHFYGATRNRTGRSMGLKSQSFRGGDRSEYLAMYGLSRFSFVCDVRRPADFGLIDFMCTLTKQEGDYLVPENTFFVQVKSNHRSIELDENAINWIYNHMTHPLLICVINKKKTTLALYSCSLIWDALMLCDNAIKITLVLSKRSFKHPRAIHKANGPLSMKDVEFQIFIGEPIFEQKLEKLEESRGKDAYAALKPHIVMDQKNISPGLRKIVTYQRGTGEQYFSVPKSHLDKIEGDLLPRLSAIAVNLMTLRHLTVGNAKKRQGILQYLSCFGITREEIMSKACGIPIEAAAEPVDGAMNDE